MRFVTVPESAVDALLALQNDLAAGKLLLETCREALGGDGPDLSDASYLNDRSFRAVHAAIAPQFMGIRLEPFGAHMDEASYSLACDDGRRRESDGE